MNLLTVGVNKLAEIKQRCRRELNPIMRMLMFKRFKSSEIMWMGFVKLTEQKVLEHPDHYLDKLPPPELIETVVRELFAEFISEHLRRRHHNNPF